MPDAKKMTHQSSPDCWCHPVEESPGVWLHQPPTKRCSKCGETKPTSEFSPLNNAEHRPGSLSAWCKSCHRQYEAERHRQNRALIRALYRKRPPSGHNANLRMRRALYGH